MYFLYTKIIITVLLLMLLLVIVLDHYCTLVEIKPQRPDCFFLRWMNCVFMVFIFFVSILINNVS